ncbi:twin-arginine translocase subunit TatC [Patulibacter sp. SYSU D01012]|uniref:twin-arginine translocase subunit TatC n=1 Tax=Patulibacter sp. SYSU D01012 TaxID=2817381 RepID=UPI001B307C0E|nr:twin-arginine translocase subunit TatC [Patulibacter sp. SYSU D01012]
MAKLRPVSSEDRFTLVEHLSELRTRIISALAIFIVAFGICYWQADFVLKVVNTPLTESQRDEHGQCRTAGDSLEQSNCFDRAVAQALKELEPVVRDAQGRGGDAQQADRALQALKRAQELAPRNVNRKPVTLGVAEPFFQTLNVAMYGALVLSLPLLLYQLYAFLIPAFTARERRVIVPLLVGVPFLFYAGAAFGYFLALPRAVDFLQNFNDKSFDILVQAKDYYKFTALFVAGSGVIFQVPVVVIAVTRLGIVSPQRLRKARGLVAVASAVIAALITPTPDAVTMLLMMAPLVVLFEASVAIAALWERRRPVGGRFADWGEDEDDDDPWPDDDDPDDGGPDDDDPWPADDDPALAAPAGEDPDSALLGDPAGPRVVGAGDDREPGERGPDAPLAGAAPGVGGVGSASGDVAPAPDGPVDEAGEADGDGDPDLDAWLREADILDAEDPYADDDPAGGADGPDGPPRA